MKNLEDIVNEAIAATLEESGINNHKSNNVLRVPIQYVIRKGQDFRGYAGTIVSGKIKKNQSVKVLPSGFETKVENIFDFNKKLSSAESGKSITFTLKDQLDVSRGDILVEKSQPCEIAHQFRIDLIWMDIKRFFPSLFSKLIKRVKVT